MSGALTTATVDETGKGQHRGANVAPELERRFIQFRQAPFPMCRKAIGIFVGFLSSLDAPEQEKSGAENEQVVS